MKQNEFVYQQADREMLNNCGYAVISLTLKPASVAGAGAPRAVFGRSKKAALIGKDGTPRILPCLRARRPPNLDLRGAHILLCRSEDLASSLVGYPAPA